MRKWATASIGCWLATLLSVSASGTLARYPTRETQPSRPATASAASPQRALLDRYCVTCHNEKLQRGNLRLDTRDVTAVARDGAVWEKVVRKLRAGVMPPAGLPRPDKATYDGFAAWLETELDRDAAAYPNPGRTEALHRLNRAEYQNAIRDLLGLEVRISDLLPADDQSYGFDNIAGVLGISPTLVERYVSAARKISRLAVGGAANATAETFRLRGDLQQDEHVDGLPFGTRGGTIIRHNFPQDAEYAIDIELQGPRNELHRLEVTLDGAQKALLPLEPAPLVPNVDGELMSPAPTVKLTVNAGPRDLGVTFVKRSAIEADGVRQPFLRPYNNQLTQPVVNNVTITGPFGAAGTNPRGDTPSRRAIFTCRPERASQEAGCARKILANLARRAYRRGVTDADLQGLLTFYNEGSAGGGFEAGVESALRRLLVSPEFLFRIERDRTAGHEAGPNTIYRISDVELASRLSFFLWSSIPDDGLLDAATRGELQQPAVLERQVRRMLADPRARALVTNFGAQWLGLRKLERATPQQDLFPDFDENLRQAMRRETDLFLESIVAEDRSVVDLVSGNYTFVNERLARHYGIPHVYGSDFRRVTFDDGSVRGGLLGQGSILTVTSYATRTSPVLRGKWVLDNLIGLPPPPPPPKVPDLVEKGRDGKVLSMRERMAQHRADAACAVCHNTMDPMGLPLESFDAVGRYRTRSESNDLIDASGALPDGSVKFDGPAGLRRALLARKELFVTTLTEKLLTYALGRGLEHYDAPAVRRITAGAAARAYRLSSLILGIVSSTPFQMRRTES
jgi:mono/diheme cytochrome c family protein